MSRFIAIVVFAACAKEPAQPLTPATPAPPPAAEDHTVHAPAAPAPAPAEYSFAFLPKDLRDRGPSFIDIQCPAGTKRVETHGYGRTHRHCETPTGTYEGPIVEFADGAIWLRGTHDGLRSGTQISANEGGVVESEYAAGHPVGHYRYRRGTIVVAEGDFDSDGRLDGDWIFHMPVSGQELTRTSFKHGTGSIEIWDWRYKTSVTSRLQCKDGLLDGTQMFHVLSAPEIYDHRVDAEYKRGLPDGAYKLTRITDNVVLRDGRYNAGAPTGTWKMIAPHPCIAMMRGGDTVDCIYGTDLPYTCTGNKCKFDQKPKHRGGDDIEPMREGDDLVAPQAQTVPRKCELGPPYLSD
jgi:hypothetical protein